jgi:hypothetical protein
MSDGSYTDLVIAHVCVQCAEPAAADSDRCEPHRDQQRKRDRAWRAARRKLHRRRGLCAECETPSDTYYCTAHSIKMGRTDAVAVDSTVDKAARIAARLKTHADGRTRYHGQDRRGSQPPDQLVAKEIADAVRLLETAAGGFALAYQLPNGTPRERAYRKECFHASLAHADRVSRVIEELCTRYGYQQTQLMRDQDYEE